MALKLPRIGIADLMALVGIIAVNCWAYSLWLQPRSAHDDFNWFEATLLEILPMADALAIGSYLMIKRRVRKERPGPFLVGFVVVGTASMLMVVIAFATLPDWILEKLDAVFQALLAQPLEQAGIGIGESLAGDFLLITAAMLFLAFPQFILAAVGGSIARHCGNKRKNERRRQASPLTDPPAVSAVS
jgi:hypothetical protein